MPLPRKANKSGAGLSDAGGIRRTERDLSVRRGALKRFSEGEDMRAPHAEGKKFPEGCAHGAVSPVRVPGSGEEPSTASPQRAHERRRTGYLPVCRRRAAPPRGSGCPQGLGKAPGKQEGGSTSSLFSSAGGGICVAEERQNAAFAIMLWPQNEASLISILSDRRRPEEAEQGRGGQEGPRAASGGLLRRLRPQPLRRLCQARGRQGEVRVRRSDRRPAEGGGPKAPLRKQDCHRINHLRRPPSVFPGRRRAFSNRIDKSLIKTIWHF